MGFDIAAWSNYGVAVVSGAAALTGLFWSSKAIRGRAGQALVLFIIPLVTGLLLLVPGQSPTALGIEIVVFGLLAGRTLLALRSEAVKDEPRAMALVDRLWPRMIITAALIAGGASLIARDAGGAVLADGRACLRPAHRAPQRLGLPSRSRR